MQKPSRTWQISPELSGLTLAAGVRALGGVSWGRARAWIATGKVFVAGELCTDERRRVVAGELVELRPNAPRPRPLVDLVAAAIIYLDEHLVVIDKPPGLSTVPFDEGERDTLDALLFRAIARRERPRRTARKRPALGIVHRLDRETSGLMVFARSWLAKQRLAAQFRAHTVQRHYVGIAHGSVPSLTVRSHLLRDRGDGLRGSREAGGRGKGSDQPPPKLAITHIELLEELRVASLIRCRLETGRTHQIRIHLSELGHPLLGERAYVRDYSGALLPAPRLMLHAAGLGFAHPSTGAPLRWDQPLPHDMQEVLEALR